MTVVTPTTMSRVTLVILTTMNQIIRNPAILAQVTLAQVTYDFIDLDPNNPIDPKPKGPSDPIDPSELIDSDPKDHQDPSDQDPSDTRHHRDLSTPVAYTKLTPIEVTLTSSDPDPSDPDPMTQMTLFTMNITI